MQVDDTITGDKNVETWAFGSTWNSKYCFLSCIFSRHMFFLKFVWPFLLQVLQWRRISEIFKQVRNFWRSSHIIEIQQTMTDRAVELLNIPEGRQCLLLDLGCGSGLSGEVLTEYGHLWVGLDISKSMLGKNPFNEQRCCSWERSGGWCFSSWSWTGCRIQAWCFWRSNKVFPSFNFSSISAIQWLCNADKSNHSPRNRLTRFFSTLYSCLARGSRAVFQFYPENATQIELITGCALKCGFSGGVVIDYPNSTKAKKYYLVLMVGVAQPLPSAKTDENDSEVKVVRNQRQFLRKSKSKRKVHDREWVLKKKELARKRGRENVPEDTKYTARKRRIKFW